MREAPALIAQARAHPIRAALADARLELAQIDLLAARDAFRQIGTQGGGLY